MTEPLFLGKLEEEVKNSVCLNCWTEWNKPGGVKTMVINEYHLNLGDEKRPRHPQETDARVFQAARRRRGIQGDYSNLRGMRGRIHSMDIPAWQRHLPGGKPRSPRSEFPADRHPCCANTARKARSGSSSTGRRRSISPKSSPKFPVLEGPTSPGLFRGTGPTQQPPAPLSNA